jgi:hypothetical protein
MMPALQHNDASITAAQNIKFNNIITEVAMFHFHWVTLILHPK